MPSIRKDLTIEIEGFNKIVTTISVFEVTATHIKVPRLYGFDHYGPPRFARMSDGVDIDPAHLRRVQFALYPAQQQCVDAMRKANFTDAQVREGTAGCILNLACGKGKTHIGIQRTLDVKKRTLVVCHSNVSVSQWIVNFHRSLPDVTVSEFHGSSGFPDTDVVVATIHPLALERSTAQYDKTRFAQWLNTFGQVIYDEIHIFGAPKFSVFFDIIHSRVQLGLSATPERSDGMELNYELKIGRILDAQADLHIEPPQFDVTVYPLKPPPPTVIVPSTEGRGGAYAEELKKVTISESRCEFLVDTMKSHFSRFPRDNMLIFCNYIEEVEFLFARLLRQFGPGGVALKSIPAEACDTAYGVNMAGSDEKRTMGIAGMYIDKVCGDICAEAIGRMADDARVLICTYKKGGTGFSPVRFRSVVIWSPTRAMIKQAVGRIQRWRDEEGMTLGPEGSWNKLPRTIYDFIDDHTVASGQYYSGSREGGRLVQSRRSTYIDAGYRVFKPKESRSVVSLEKECQSMLAELGFTAPQ